MKAQRNVEGLRQNAQKKRQEALEKVEQGIRQLLKESRAINFNTVAQAADVSKAFLYKEPEIKERIELLRQQGTKKAPELKQRASDGSKDAMIRTLRERVKKLESEVRDLRKQNEVAYGQVIEVNLLRQQVGRLQAENDRLSQQAATNNTSLIQPSGITAIEAEIQNLGVELNTTLIKLMQKAPLAATQKAMESLREAIAENRVQNRAGFFNKAIRDAWKPNEGYEEKLERHLFHQWFDWAKKEGLVAASMQVDGKIMVSTSDNQWISLAQAMLGFPPPS